MTASKFLRPVIALAVLAAAMLPLTGCEDTPPTSYAPTYVVEGFLFVGQPMRGIKVMRSQSVADTFKYSSSAVADAQVTLTANGQTYTLRYVPGTSVGDYRLPDSAITVLPRTLYSLRVQTADGAVMTAETRTPDTIRWVKAPKPIVQYPGKNDTATLRNPPDSLSLTWTPVTDTKEFMLSTLCLDTLGYGKYLASPTADTNTRINNLFNDNDPFYDDNSRWGFAQSTDIPYVWSAFKWHGMHELSVYAPDRSMLNYFKMVYWQRNPSFDPLLGNVRGGGIGVFGSCSVDKARTLLLKSGK